MNRDIAKYHDFLSYVLLSAPDDFPEEDYLQPEEQMTLERAFAELLEGLPVVSARVADEKKMLVLREMLLMALDAYRGGEDIKGAHILQEFEGAIWPSRKLEEKYMKQAEARISEEKSKPNKGMEPTR